MAAMAAFVTELGLRPRRACVPLHPTRWCTTRRRGRSSDCARWLARRLFARTRQSRTRPRHQPGLVLDHRRLAPAPLDLVRRAQSRSRAGRPTATGSRSSPIGSRAAAACSSCPSDGPGEAREMTHHRSSIGQLAWSPDGRTIAYTTSFDPDNPDEQPQPAGRAPQRPRHPPPGLQAGQSRLGQRRAQPGLRRRRDVGRAAHADPRARRRALPQWSPDGRRLAAHITSPTASTRTWR